VDTWLIAGHTAGYSWDVLLAGYESGYRVPIPIATASNRVFLYDAPSQGHLSSSRQPYSTRFHEHPFAHVVPAMTLRVRAGDVWVFPGRPMAM
jgi:hypothetical protein